MIELKELSGQIKLCLAENSFWIIMDRLLWQKLDLLKVF